MLVSSDTPFPGYVISIGGELIALDATCYQATTYEDVAKTVEISRAV